MARQKRLVKNYNGRDLFLSFTIIHNNCLERQEKRKRERRRERERERKRAVASCDLAVRLLRRNGGTRRDIANGEIVSCTGTHSPVHASSICVQVTRVYCHGSVQ